MTKIVQKSSDCLGKHSDDLTSQRLVMQGIFPWFVWVALPVDWMPTPGYCNIYRQIWVLQLLS